MPKSRGRKPKQRSGRGPRRLPGTAGSAADRTQTAKLWAEHEPWIRAMMMSAEAEARGDAVAALDVIEAFATGPDGEFFWRPWRVRYLHQIALLAPILPRWATSRWICQQALQLLHEGNRSRTERAFELAVELRGGAANLPGKDEADAFGRVIDGDWVFRQVFLYDLGGLQFFVRDHASSALLAGADSMHDWARTPMGGYRLIERTPAAETWLDLASHEKRTVPNIGSACLVLPGEHVLGRLVPVEGGVLFESRPLLVSASTAQRVAASPPDWLEAMRDEPTDHESLAHRSGRRATLLSDVPTPLWQLIVLDGRRPPAAAAEWERVLARCALDTASELRECADSPDDDVDRWACLAAALLDPGVVTALPDVVIASDRAVLETMADVLPAPAGTVCRDAVLELFDAA